MNAEKKQRKQVFAYNSNDKSYPSGTIYTYKNICSDQLNPERLCHSMLHKYSLQKRKISPNRQPFFKLKKVVVYCQKILIIIVSKCVQVYSREDKKYWCQCCQQTPQWMSKLVKTISEQSKNNQWCVWICRREQTLNTKNTKKNDK